MIEFVVAEKISCFISGQQAVLKEEGENSSGLRYCEGCQLARLGGSALVVKGVIIECGDGLKIHNKILAVEQAVK